MVNIFDIDVKLSDHMPLMAVCAIADDSYAASHAFDGHRKPIPGSRKIC
jgi:hypothetical protein